MNKLAMILAMLSHLCRRLNLRKLNLVTKLVYSAESNTPTITRSAVLNAVRSTVMKILNLHFDSYTYWRSSLEEHTADIAMLDLLTSEEIKSAFVVNEWPEDNTNYVNSFSGYPALATEAQVTELLMAGFAFKVTKGLETNPEVLFNAKEPVGTTDMHMNNRVEVHMPGQALAMYNETLLMEDACTDALQNELANGWRIIAVCPQPDQRRPDYVLGRYNPNVGVDTEAKRAG